MLQLSLRSNGNAISFFLSMFVLYRYFYYCSNIRVHICSFIYKRNIFFLKYLLSKWHFFLRSEIRFVLRLVAEVEEEKRIRSIGGMHLVKWVLSPQTNVYYL